MKFYGVDFRSMMFLARWLPRAKISPSRKFDYGTREMRANVRAVRN